jgi:hypothetical protein
MSPSCDLAEISTFYYNYPIRPHFSDKLKVSNLDLKFCPHEGLHQTRLSTKFQNFWIDYLRDTSMLAKRRFFMDIVLCMDTLENPYLGDNLSKGSETL